MNITDMTGDEISDYAKDHLEGEPPMLTQLTEGEEDSPLYWSGDELYGQNEVWRLVGESVVPGYCAACGYILTSLEPDASEVKCPGCGENAMSSVLVYWGLI